jgi:hypothetical protein
MVGSAYLLCGLDTIRSYYGENAYVLLSTKYIGWDELFPLFRSIGTKNGNTITYLRRKLFYVQINKEFN